MRVDLKKPPRRFAVGDGTLQLAHVADVALDWDEMVTFVTDQGTEFDVVRKDWGYYATPSLNGRLPDKGLRPVLCASGDRLYLLLCEAGREADFADYLAGQKMRALRWLDTAHPADLEDRT